MNQARAQPLALFKFYFSFFFLLFFEIQGHTRSMKRSDWCLRQICNWLWTSSQNWWRYALLLCCVVTACFHCLWRAEILVALKTHEHPMRSSSVKRDLLMLSNARSLTPGRCTCDSYHLYKRRWYRWRWWEWSQTKSRALSCLHTLAFAHFFPGEAKRLLFFPRLSLTIFFEK